MPAGKGRHRRMLAQQVDVGEHLASPQAQRLFTERARPQRVAAVERVPGLRDDPIECHRIELVAVGCEPVTQPDPGDDAPAVGVSRSEKLAEPTDVALQFSDHGRRRSLSPERVNDRIAIQTGALVQDEEPQDGSLEHRP
jgi:hypothetical protein